ncbi:mite allergen Der f 3-like [Schistocerca cancellata]|uniref:mite allergen Der f 3-like n=1 Tax=Schistocerca cancellata TaxID=274614 RepID=UPI0021192DD9|nr:mite allergen Der f 3-like [Schistocerca cancellata]
MSQTTLLLLLIVASVRCAPGGSVHRRVSVQQGRIVNGVEAAPGEFPHQVSLRANGYHQCGASILNQYWVVTAAHCVDVPNTYDVLAGTNIVTDGGTKHSVTDITSHRDYDPNDSWINDIAVLKVSPPFSIDGVTVAPIQLPEQGEQVPDGANVTVIGWGDLWYHGLSPIELRKVDLQIVNQEECEAVWNSQGYAVHPTQICTARFEDVNYDSCKGDSGGPLLYEGKIVGMVSWSYECAAPPYPSVGTRVSSYVDWIIDNTNGTLVPH